MSSIIIQWSLTSFVVLCPLYLYVQNRISRLTFNFTLVFNFIICIFLPLLYHYNLYLQRAVLYLFFLDRPSNLESLKYVETFGLEKGRNVYVDNEGVKLGVWHLPPSCYSNDLLTDEDFVTSFDGKHPVIFYVHGNLGTRATKHRVELYKILTGFNYHVITFDYRCYGDSSYSEPYEDGMVSDALAVYTWLLEMAGNSSIFVWGHSLGTGLATHMVAELSKINREPGGVILEAPFNNMASEIEVHPFGTFFRVLPWYNMLFVKQYYYNREDFNSAKYILLYDSPTLILHAEDDGIIPVRLGEKLYKIGKTKRSPQSGPVTMLTLSAKYKYGHKFIYKSSHAMNFVSKFLNKHKCSNYNSCLND